jgi:hypothetical protein
VEFGVRGFIRTILFQGGMVVLTISPIGNFSVLIVMRIRPGQSLKHPSIKLMQVLVPHVLNGLRNNGRLKVLDN